MNEPTLTIAGNLTADPELRYTPTGRPAVHFTVASSPRYQENGQWVDGNTTYYDAEAWGTTAENVAESLQRGDRVLAHGRIRTDVWTPTTGTYAGKEQRRARLIIDEIATSLRYATAPPTKASPQQQEATDQEPNPEPAGH